MRWIAGAFSLVIAASAGAEPADALASSPPPTQLEGLAYDADFTPWADHDPAIPTVESLIGFRAGERAATHAQIETCLKAWAEASDRATLEPYATTYEGRDLYLFVVTTAANQSRIGDILEAQQRLTDGRDAPANQPAIAWMGYSIHGDETSGSDAALALAYHLVADRSQRTRDLLSDVVVVIDPVMNPDGRDRFLKQIREHRGLQPSVDDQSLLHAGYWPWGRMNHYLFDLNRDWILAVHPETRGRIRQVQKWNPLLFVDAHEMGSQDTYLFSPPRAPVNPDFAATIKKWAHEFAADQAAAFDESGWRYYTGEWNDNWYPGYSDAWAAMRGALGILYEQAGIAEDGVRTANGRITTYRQSVHHQFVSSLANLASLRERRADMQRDYSATRAEARDPGGPYAGRCWAIPPSTNHARIENLVEVLTLQGIEVRRVDRAFTAGGTDQFGRGFDQREFPAGTLVIPGAQPEARLASTTLGFDPRMSTEFLETERRSLLRNGEGRMYDTTAWNLTMFHAVEAYQLRGDAPSGEPATFDDPATAIDGPANATAWVISGHNDDSVAAAARLMERGVLVRVARRPFEWGGAAYERGSVVVMRDDNRENIDDALDALRITCEELGLTAQGSSTGLDPDVEGPDAGGEYFPLLERPRIAVLGRGDVSAYSFGETWFTIDRRLGIRASYLGSADRADLRRYNVLIIPEMWGSDLPVGADELKTWVRAGGTLIALGGGARRIATEEAGLTGVRTIEGALDDLAAHERRVLMEWAGRSATIDEDAVWSHEAGAMDSAPWEDLASHPDKKTLEARDAWAKQFMPQGAFIAARADDEHWLTFGVAEHTPVLFGASTSLMVADSGEAVIRLGVFDEAASDSASANSNARSNSSDSDSDGSDAGKSDDAKRERTGFAALPEGVTLRMRMSGLVWPEASARLANTVYLARERVGAGQVILFAGNPVFRGASMGTSRLLTNAIVYGPGCGSRTPIEP